MKRLSLIVLLSVAGYINATEKTETLLIINGKPIISIEKFEEFVTKQADANPQLKQMMQYMPDLKKELYKAMVGEEIILEWAKQNNIEKTEEYKKELKLHQELIRKGLAAKYFQKDALPEPKASKNDIINYYNENKEQFLISPEGIIVKGVSFETEAKAKAFKEKSKGDFEKAAKEEKTFKDFEIINQTSSVDKKVKDKVLSLNKFPSIEIIIINDNMFWVINAEKKVDASYREFNNELEQKIEQMLNQKKLLEDYEKKITELKKQYKVIEDLSYFEPKKKEEETAPKTRVKTA